MKNTYTPQNNLIGKSWNSVKGLAEVIAHQCNGNEEKVGVKYTDVGGMAIIDIKDFDRTVQTDTTRVANDIALEEEVQKDLLVKKVAHKVHNPMLEEYLQILKLEGITPLQLSRKASAMEKLVNYKGKNITRTMYVHTLLSQGATLSENGKRFMLSGGSFFDVKTKAEKDFAEFLINLK